MYTKEEWVFDTHIQCSKKLKVPLGYIRENLKYGYMDYFGDAINYLSEVLNIDEYCKSEWSYLDNSKSPSEIFNKKYKSIIKRGGKKKVELVNKKGDILEIFKSLEECAIYLQKEKNEVIQMLKYGDTKVGRNFIRYSLRSI